MSSAIGSTAALLLIGMISACSSDGGTSPATLSIVGVWNQGANLRDTVNNQNHIHTGYFSFVQERNGFVGDGEQSGFCSGPDGHYEGPLANGVPYDIADGVQEGEQISFKSELCTYQGTLSADGDHITGTARCAYTQGGVNFVWVGDWLANRER
jgi:hypothetical protein